MKGIKLKIILLFPFPSVSRLLKQNIPEGFFPIILFFINILLLTEICKAQKLTVRSFLFLSLRSLQGLVFVELSCIIEWHDSCIQCHLCVHKVVSWHVSFMTKIFMVPVTPLIKQGFLWKSFSYVGILHLWHSFHMLLKIMKYIILFSWLKMLHFFLPHMTWLASTFIYVMPALHLPHILIWLSVFQYYSSKLDLLWMIYNYYLV